MAMNLFTFNEKPLILILSFTIFYFVMYFLALFLFLYGLLEFIWKAIIFLYYWTFAFLMLAIFDSEPISTQSFFFLQLTLPSFLSITSKVVQFFF